jgi:photosystem II stability/assembly factor-like uncharacterized protein
MASWKDSGRWGSTVASALNVWRSTAFLCAVCLAASARPARAGINVWTSHGLAVGDIRVLAVDPATPTTLYGGTGDCGGFGCYGIVFKSTDAGNTWSRSELPAVFALAIDPGTSTTLYAGTVGCGGRGCYGIVYKSTNAGNTWSWPVETGVLDQVYALAIDPATPTTLYAGTAGGVSKSTDGGGTWSFAGLQSRAVSSLAIDPTTPTTLYAADPEWDVFKSTDGADTWTDTHLPAGPGVLAIDPVRPDTLYAAVHWFPAPGGCPRGGCHDECYGGGVFKSTDGGATWNTTGLTDAYVEALAIDLVSPATLYAAAARSSACSNAGVLKTTDGGGTWRALNNGLADVDVLALAIDPVTSSRIYAGTAGGGVFAIDQVEVASDSDGCTIAPGRASTLVWWLLVLLLVLARCGRDRFRVGAPKAGRGVVVGADPWRSVRGPQLRSLGGVSVVGAIAAVLKRPPP